MIRHGQCPRLIGLLYFYAAQQIRPDLVLRMALARVRLVAQRLDAHALISVRTRRRPISCLSEQQKILDSAVSQERLDTVLTDKKKMLEIFETWAGSEPCIQGS
ncbi:hypothetical protein IHE30_04220 [Mycetohabitans sp. B46]